MTVAEAIEALNKLPQDAELMVDGDMGPYTVDHFKEAKLADKRGIMTLEYHGRTKGNTVVVVW